MIEIHTVVAHIKFRGPVIFSDQTKLLTKFYLVTNMVVVANNA